MSNINLDRIQISDLRLSCLIGINDTERVNKQDVVVNIDLFADLKKACQTDDIADTVDYKALKNRIKEFVITSQFFLLEKLASEIAKQCFLSDELIKEVLVNVQKPGALTSARTVAVELKRERAFYAN